MIAQLQSEHGFTLVEALVSVAILTLALVVFIAGLSTGVLSSGHSDRLSTAHELARSQMEYVKELPYQPAPSTYPTVAPTAGYTVSAAATDIPGGLGDPGIQLITVQVVKDGAPIFTLEGYRVDR